MTDSIEQAPPAQIPTTTAVWLWLLLVLAGLSGGVVLLALAVTVTVNGSRPPWTAVMLLTVSALALWLGRRTAPRTEPFREPPPDPWPSWMVMRISALPLPELNWRLAAGLAALGLTLFNLLRMPRLTVSDSYTFVTVSWLLAGGLYLLAVAPPHREARDWDAWLRANWLTITAVCGVVLLAFVLRAWRIDTIPFTLGGDEGSQGLEAVRVLNGELRNPFATGWLGVPTMSFFFQSLSISALGQTILALRLPWAFVGTATVLTTFFLTRRLTNTTLALVTAVLLAVYHYHIHYSRLGSNQIADPLFMSVALLLLYRGLDRRSHFDWALTGSVSGLAFYFYAGARLTPVVIAAVLGYQFVLNPRRFWHEHKAGLAIMVGAFLIVAAPILQYALRYPGDFNARLNQVGIIQSGWLEREIGIRGESMVAILWDQFRRAALAFNYYPDRVVWYGLRGPLLDPLFGGLFLLGLIYATLQLFDRTAGPRVAPLVAWWWGGMLLGGMLTESPPSSQRLITLAVPVCFFIAYAVWEMLQLAQQFVRQLPVRWVMAGVTAVFALMSLNTYFVDYTPQRIYGGPNAELATEIAPVLNRLKQTHRLQFVGAPWMYWGFATLPYLVTGADAADVMEPIPDAATAAALLPPDKGAVFIVLPPREAELAHLHDAFPNGALREFYSPVDNRRMVSLYIVDRP